MDRSIIKYAIKRLYIPGIILINTWDNGVIMICEMCGKEVPVTKTVIVEGSRLNVCPNCSRFGEDYRSNQSGAPISSSVIEQRLEKRERRMKTKDIYSGTATTELVDNYGEVIRKAREAKGMDLEQFSASILEKKGTMSKIEANALVPDDKLIKKIEKALDIKLTELVQSGATVGGGNGSNKMTLGNFIRKE
jgi:putative transcription factor